MANNSNKKWKPEEKKKLIELAEGNTPTRIIALKLGRRMIHSFCGSRRR